MTESTPRQSRVSLRQETLRQRDAIPSPERLKKSSAIAELVRQLDLVQGARTIFTYVNFRSEVETMGLIAGWLAAGKMVCVPLTLASESRLVAYQIKDPSHDLSPGYCRIPEPDARRLPPVDPAEIEVIVLPGSVFDLHGGRLGYGGGFYDRFIASQAPHAFRIGLAFDLQVVTELPLLAHDQPLHALVTEERVLHFTHTP